MAWDTVLFDLDGTVTDPKEGITKAVAYALNHFGVPVEDLDSLTRFIGPPLDEAFAEYYGFDEKQSEQAVEKFREYYNTQGWMENVPYPGMANLLSDLGRAGKQVVIATSKPEDTALCVLHHFDLAQYFHVICGAFLDKKDGSKKANVIRDALQRAAVTELDRVVMVGDRRHDMEGARQVGISAIGVLYGYGDRPEHEAAGAQYIAEDLQQLRKLLLEK